LKFLIIQTAFIGDVILATPIIEKLHEYYPDAQIDFLLRKGNESLLEGHPYLHQVLIWDKKENKTKNLFKMISQVRANKYDYVINIHRHFSSGLITILSGANTTIGFDKNPFSFLFTKKVKHIIGTKENPKHEVERNIDLIASITDNKLTKPKLYPSESDYKETLQYKSQKYICIAPTSVWFTKQFPAHKWVELLQKLPPEYKVYLLGSPSDKTFCNNLIQSSQRKNIENLSGKLTLLQSAALMKDAMMNYVNDSAPMHLASAMSASVTAIYCSTVPEFGFGPLSDNSRIIETNLNLDCRPCGLHGFDACPKGHFKCAESIDITSLL
jgi:lipopolysaccharide heptosyltransferase II